MEADYQMSLLIVPIYIFYLQQKNCDKKSVGNASDQRFLMTFNDVYSIYEAWLCL